MEQLWGTAPVIAANLLSRLISSAFLFLVYDYLTWNRRLKQVDWVPILFGTIICTVSAFSFNALFKLPLIAAEIQPDEITLLSYIFCWLVMLVCLFLFNSFKNKSDYVTLSESLKRHLQDTAQKLVFYLFPLLFSVIVGNWFSSILLVLISLDHLTTLYYIFSAAVSSGLLVGFYCYIQRDTRMRRALERVQKTKAYRSVAVLSYGLLFFILIFHSGAAIIIRLFPNSAALVLGSVIIAVLAAPPLLFLAYRRVNRAVLETAREHDKKPHFVAHMDAAARRMPLSSEEDLRESVRPTAIPEVDDLLGKFYFLCADDGIDFSAEDVGGFKVLSWMGFPTDKLLPVILNLLDNARLACLDQPPDEPRRIQVACYLAADQSTAFLEVYDSGAAMPKSMVLDVGRPGVTGRAGRGGNGYGLFSVIHTIESYRGGVDCAPLTGTPKHISLSIPCNRRKNGLRPFPDSVRSRTEAG